MTQQTNRTQQLLQRLQRQISQLDTDLNAAKQQDHLLRLQRFDNQLFNPMIKNPKEYLKEIEKNYVFLEQQVASHNVAQTVFLTDKLIAQIAALQRELATQSLRQFDLTQKSKTTAKDRYQKLSQNQDYQRRLKDMIRDKESLLSQKTTVVDQQTIQREITVLEGRYQRCCNAIKVLEYQIEQYD